MAIAGQIRARRGIVPVRRQPHNDAEMVTELLFGEGFDIHRTEGEWAQGKCLHDGYPGWCVAESLALGPTPTHRVSALRAFLFPEPNFKRPPLRALSLGALITVVQTAGGYAEIDGGGWLAGVAITPVGKGSSDWAGTALRFAGVPYLWGGRSSLGLDCSGLIQVSLAAAGIAAPRDSGDQAKSVGFPIDPADGFVRGDLVFLPGHVATMIDDTNCVNASSDPMAVVVEPLANLAARLERREGRGIIGARRVGQ